MSALYRSLPHDGSDERRRQRRRGSAPMQRSRSRVHGDADRSGLPLLVDLELTDGASNGDPATTVTVGRGNGDRVRIETGTVIGHSKVDTPVVPDDRNVNRGVVRRCSNRVGEQFARHSWRSSRTSGEKSWSSHHSRSVARNTLRRNAWRSSKHDLITDSATPVVLTR